MQFTKMHAAGNDFSLFDGTKENLPDLSALALAVCDRHFGTGGDGIMAALPSEKADIRMVYYNSDGTPGEMCGNGLRCFSKFVYTKKLVNQSEFIVETGAGPLPVKLTVNAQDEVEFITIAMGYPLLGAKDVPTTLAGDPVIDQIIDVDGEKIGITALRVGVPHAVVIVEDLDRPDILELGKKIEAHGAFPARVNVNFVQVLNRSHIKVKTYERGAGHTLACGTGCCASAVAGRLLSRIDREITVDPEGGRMYITVGDDYAITLRGTAEFICEGAYSPWIMRRAKK